MSHEYIDSDSVTPVLNRTHSLRTHSMSPEKAVKCGWSLPGKSTAPERSTWSAGSGRKGTDSGTDSWTSEKVKRKWLFTLNTPKEFLTLLKDHWGNRSSTFLPPLKSILSSSSIQNHKLVNDISHFSVKWFVTHWRIVDATLVFKLPVAYRLISNPYWRLTSQLFFFRILSNQTVRSLCIQRITWNRSPAVQKNRIWRLLLLHHVASIRFLSALPAG